MRSGALVYWLVQVALFPCTLVGYILFIMKLVVFTRATGVSATALSPLYARWMLHQLGARRDDASALLMRALPNVSAAGLRLLAAPTLLTHRLTGYVPRTHRYPYPGDPPMIDQASARTTFFDQELERRLDTIEQFVILGAGWDTRAFRLPAGARIRVFEVDAPKTQALKRRMLQNTGLDTSHITFVAVDFLVERWLDTLTRAGFDPARPSFFLWEGVTVYLDRNAVEGTLRTIAGTAPGSAVAFDYFTDEIVQGRSAFMRYAAVVLKAVGEPFRFGISGRPPVRERIAELLWSCGLALGEHRIVGGESETRRALGGYAVGIVLSPAE